VHSKGYAARMGALTVSTLARQVGVRPDTIRYYERAGLLPPPLRSPAGYRQYDPATIDRLRFIRGAQRLGLRLREIADLLAVRDRGACPCGHAEALVRQRLSELDAEIARLVDIRQELTRLAADCAAGACPDGVWPCEAGFIQAGKEVTTT
jgi:DNA-binding transcriptional MerR regulator